MASLLIFSTITLALVGVNGTPVHSEGRATCKNYNTILSLGPGPVRAGCQYATWRTAFLAPGLPGPSPNITDLEFRLQLGSQNGAYHALHASFFCCHEVGQEGTELDPMGVNGCERVSASRIVDGPRNSPVSKYFYRHQNIGAACPGSRTASFIVVARGPYTMSHHVSVESPWDSVRVSLDGAHIERTIDPGTRHFFHVSVPAGKHSVRVLASVDRSPFRANVLVSGRWGDPVIGDELNRVLQVSPSAEVLRDCIEIANPRTGTLYLTVYTPPLADFGRYTVRVVSNIADSSCARAGDTGPI